jgi:hypothetical protein
MCPINTRASEFLLRNRLEKMPITKRARLKRPGYVLLTLLPCIFHWHFSALWKAMVFFLVSASPRLGTLV